MRLTPFRLPRAAFVLLALALLLRVAAGLPAALLGGKADMGPGVLAPLVLEADAATPRMSTEAAMVWAEPGSPADDSVADACEAHTGDATSHKHCVVCWLGASVHAQQATALNWLKVAAPAPTTALWIWWPAVFLDGPLRPPMSCTH